MRYWQPFKSVTVWGAIILGVGRAIAAYFVEQGATADAETVQMLTDGVGAAVAIVGLRRAKAKEGVPTGKVPQPVAPSIPE